MSNTFRTSRQAMIDNQKLGKYVSYAIGEVILVVLGILIAVNINNWNEERKEARELNRILQIVHDEMVTDTTNIEGLLKYYDEMEPYYKLIMNEPPSEETVDTCKICPSLITALRVMPLEDKGMTLLKEFTNVSSSEPDTLVSQVLSFHESVSASFKNAEDFSRENVLRNLSHMEENYEWFADLIQGNMSEAYKDYMMNSYEFRNKVVLSYVLIYTNYTNIATFYRDQARLYLPLLEERIKN